MKNNLNTFSLKSNLILLKNSTFLIKNEESNKPQKK